MKKVFLLTIALALIAAPVLAMDMGTVSVVPLSSGIAQEVPIEPIGYKPVLDPVTNQPVIDPLTGLQKQERTWTEYMYWAKLGKVVQFQSVKLEKIHPERKVSCGAGWITEQNTVLQQGKHEIMTRWPLLYEVNGTEFRLTVTYNTVQKLAYPSPPFPSNLASRSHVEVYRWIVVWDTWAAFDARLAYFTRTPAGICETFVVTPNAAIKIGTYINGYGSPSLGNYLPGIKQYVSNGNPVAAAIRFADLEAYIDSVCVSDCNALYISGRNINTPDPFAEAILDNPTVPATSILLNDLWAVGKKLGVLTNK